ncbi:MFP1 attachment factor 1-like [Neltuma alba]|uniref:MFP1 attachment factor 1-like n=1 Tax=Neltuma alba TaxID=207710 RepID=UPI0010A2B762|nr:MFP1 attachment factor 1-like [Prosopis alba]
MEAQSPLNQTLCSQSISFSVWPPTQRTRDAVIHRLIETLSTPSVLSKRYGTLSPEDASAAARRIEDEAFSTAAASASLDDYGIEIIQLYSKEISRLMLDTVKATAALDNDATKTPDSAMPGVSATESKSQSPSL